MGSDITEDGLATADDINSGEMESKSNGIDSLEVVSSFGDFTCELSSAAESVTRIELDLACSSEKLVNLDLLVMHVASRENDFEVFVLEEDSKLEGSVVKAFEFDLLYLFLDSEVIELYTFLSDVQTDVITSGNAISSFKQLEDDFMEMEKKLQDCEESLKLSFEQLADIKVQSANFQRVLLSSSGDEKWKYENELKDMENGSLSSINTKIKMQTLEQQRHILKLLEKSLAREMDLENKLSESRQTEEDLNFRLQQEVVCMEEEAEIVYERLFEAENNAEILLGVSKELFQQLQVAQFNINRSIQRKGELESQCQGINEQLKEKEHVLMDSEHSRDELMKKINELEQKLSEFLSQVQSGKDFSEESNELPSKIYDRGTISDESKGQVTETEKSTESAESEFKLRRESNMGLNNDLSRLKKSNDDAAERVEQLERELRESEIQRLHAEASAEACEEKNYMLNCTIEDMNNLIKDLKFKIAKAERQTESVEDKCITLSETNAELIGEINFLRGRSESLEASMLQADEAKKETAKDVRTYTKLITDLVVQLALERERLHTQISSLTKVKRVSVNNLRQLNEDFPDTTSESLDAKTKVFTLSNINLKHGTSGKGGNEKISASSDEIGRFSGDLLANEIKMGHVASASNLDETVRNIDAKQLNFKYVSVAILVVAISMFAAYLFQQW